MSRLYHAFVRVDVDNSSSSHLEQQVKNQQHTHSAAAAAAKALRQAYPEIMHAPLCPALCPCGPAFASATPSNHYYGGVQVLVMRLPHPPPVVTTVQAQWKGGVVHIDMFAHNKSGIADMYVYLMTRVWHSNKAAAAHSAPSNLLNMPTRLGTDGQRPSLITGRGLRARAWCRSLPWPSCKAC
jgi:hypothetical protein